MIEGVGAGKVGATRFDDGSRGLEGVLQNVDSRPDGKN